MILIDELVAYWRNEVDSERVYTFLQALTQSVSASKDAALVVTLPESQEEAGGERGMQALETLGRLFARIEAVWEPLAVNQAFEVVSRRLFGEVLNPAERDRTCEAFSRMYANNRTELPAGMRGTGLPGKDERPATPSTRRSSNVSTPTGPL